MLKLEEGKYYRDAKGRKHGPMRVSNWDRQPHTHRNAP